MPRPSRSFFPPGIVFPVSTVCMIAQRLVMQAVEMPDDTARRLIGYIRQNNGRLGKSRREGEFHALTDAEASRLESIVAEAFDIAME
jgi:hypothetical protein